MKKEEQIIVNIIDKKPANILGVDSPVNSFVGKIIAIVHRKDDVEENG